MYIFPTKAYPHERLGILLCPKCFYRIHTSGFICWINPEEKSDSDRKTECQYNMPGRDRRIYYRKEHIHKKNQSMREPYSDDSSEKREDHRFYQKLLDNISILRTDRLPNPDLLRAFCDSNKENIHDSDSSDKQRNSSDPR